MKKISAIFLVFLIAVTLFACDNKHETKDTTENANIQSTSGNPGNNSIIIAQIKRTEMMNSHDVKITAKSTYAEHSVPTVELDIENNGSKKVTVEAISTTINGYLFLATNHLTVEAKSTATLKCTFSYEMVYMLGIESVNSFSFKFRITDPDSGSLIYQSERCTLKVSDDSIPAYDETGAVLYSEKGLKIILQKKANAQSFWGNSLMLYIDNQTTKEYKIFHKDGKLNSKEFDLAVVKVVPPGLKALTYISVPEASVKALGISTPEKAELSVEVENMADREDKFVTPSGILDLR